MKKSLIILFAAAGILAAGCAKFDEMNTSKDQLTTEQAQPYSLFARAVYKGIYADYQRNFNLYDDMYANYFSDNTSWWSGQGYAYNDGWAGCLWWEFYTQSLQYTKLIKSKCEGNETYASMAAIADVFEVYSWARHTDRWGDIPYTGAGEGEVVAYESQETIYADLLKRLEADAKVLATATDQYTPGKYDMIFGGDYTKWTKFANSLMLRLATRVSRVAPDMAKEYANKAIAAGLMTSYEDCANVAYDASVWSDYLDRLSYDWYQTAPSNVIVSVLNGTNPGYTTGVADPRLPIFFQAASLGENAGKYVSFSIDKYFGEYFGEREMDANGIYQYHYATLNEQNKNGYFYFDTSHTSSKGNLAFPMMTYSETLFCRAELALRGIVSGDAKALFEEGVKASINEAAYHTANCGDGLAQLNSSEVDAYVRKVSGMFGSDKEAQLKSIIMQKWIALYPNSTEGWNEIRRTGYPDIASGVCEYPTLRDGALVDKGNLIMNLSYPDNEYNYNEASMPADYQKSGSKFAKREQYGVWWSLAGKGNTYKADQQPKNF